MIDATRVTEVIEIFEDAFDRQEQASILQKEAKTMMKDYCERSEINPKTMFEVYKTYSAWRRGNFQWGESGDADDFTELLVSVMDTVTGPKKV